jgi:nucleoside diphosphate-linked moiety X motif protein 19
LSLGKGMAGKYWREAASLMLVIRNGISRTSSDFKVLMMKRSSKSKFMPNACVFPGGVVDSADFHNDWLHLLEDHNVDSLPQWTSQSQRPMIYEVGTIS